MANVKFERLPTWRQAMALSERMYKLTAGFPPEEKSGLAATIRRGVTAVPAKIADAHGRDDLGEAVKSLAAAQAAIRELQTHLDLSKRLNFVSGWSARPAIRKCVSLHKLLGAHIARLEIRIEELASEDEMDAEFDQERADAA